MTLEVEVFDDEIWAGHAARRWSAFMEQHSTARLCLPTGDTPRPLYALSAPIADFAAATIFLLDEFDLPPGNPARGDEMSERDFLDLLPDRPRAVHRLNFAVRDVAEECRRFERLVDDGGLDLTLLGLGANGHLGLNEPGSAPDSPTRVTRVAPTTAAGAGRYGSAIQPERGMTLGLRPLLASREIWLLVTGSHKARILERVMKGPIGPDVPATYLRDHDHATVLADRSAAALL